MSSSPVEKGFIQSVSQDVKYLLNYKSQELKGRNVKVLMPKILEVNHDKFIDNYFRTNNARLINRQKILFARNKEGYLVLIELLVKSVPIVDSDKAIFIGFMKHISSSHNYIQPPTQYQGLDYHIIVTDDEGYIHGFTENCWESFGLNPKFVFGPFGDPSGAIKMPQLIHQYTNPQFHNTLLKKPNGLPCVMKTKSIKDVISKDMLTREEQSVLAEIPQSVNINLQIDDLVYDEGKINLKMLKILKLAGMAQVDTISESEVEIQETDSIMTDAIESIHGKKPKSSQYLELDSLSNFEEEHKGQSESFGDDNNGSVSSTSSTDRQNMFAKQLLAFRQSLQRRKIPSSIKRLNNVVLVMVVFIFLFSIFDSV